VAAPQAWHGPGSGRFPLAASSLWWLSRVLARNMERGIYFVVSGHLESRAVARRSLHPRPAVAGAAALLGVAVLLLGACAVGRWRSSLGLASASSGKLGSGSVQMDARADTSGFCGVMEQDAEYHTKARLASLHATSAEQCCALCDGEPLCGAWTWGQQRGVDDLTDVCTLETLARNEKIVKIRRSGIVSGLPSSSVTKHGAVADMISAQVRHELGAAAGRAAAGAARAYRGILDNETCPGKVNVSGHGPLLVVAAEWSSPEKRAAPVDVPQGLWVLAPQLPSRAFLANRCTQGKSQTGDFAALKLLGKTLRYTTDLSGAGCGCGASLHLVPMRQSTVRSMCADFSCGAAGGSCRGAACAELAVQDANQYAWSTSVHAHDDVAGLGVGYSGGGEGRKASRDWGSAHYGPGAHCIDTTWPFEVAVSFPRDEQGMLKAVEVHLSQAGRSCPLRARIGSYSFHGRDSFAELSAALASGVTPAFSYRNSRELLWLDGVGRDGQGPCVRDSPEACANSVRFYNFEVEEVKKEHDMDSIVSERTPPSRKSPLDMAIASVHMHQRHKAESVKRAKLARAVAAQGEAEDRDQERTAGQPGSGARSAALSGGKVEWDVLVPVKVHAEASQSSEVIGTKNRGDVLVGSLDDEGWVALSHEPGHVWTKLPKAQVGDSPAKTILHKRTVNYEKITHDSCEEAGMFPILDVTACEAAAFALGYYDTTVNTESQDVPQPEGCHLVDGKLFLTTTAGSRGGLGAGSGRALLCSSRSYPTSTATTTTTTATTRTETTSSTVTSTTATTRTSTSTTHATTAAPTTRVFTTTLHYWGFPSLFCFSVMQTSTYELGLVKEQIKFGAGIFGCDEHAVFSQDPVTELGRLPRNGDAQAGAVVKTIWFRKAKVWVSRDHTAANTLLFMQVWEAVKVNGRYKNHHWTIKADPDAIVLPWRLRKHLSPHTGPKTYLVNCNKYPGTKNFPMIYGALEAYSKGAMEAYFGGALRCKLLLKWHEWGEDFFMGRCMKFLKVKPFNDFGLLGDARCMGANCDDGTSAAYHDFKNISGWFSCWRNATKIKDHELENYAGGPAAHKDRRSVAVFQ